MLAELERRFARELWVDERLSVHRETTLSALADALEVSHPACLRLVGPEFFRALARRFARDVPSRSPDLCDWGGELADYLARFEPARALPYLPDVARLEWALHRARHAALAPPADPARLSERVTFRLPAGTALLDSPYPVDRIWEANDSPVDLAQGGARLVIAREPDGARFTRVSAEELALLSGLAANQSLDEAAAAWTAGPESLGRFLARAAARRWLSASG